MGKGVGYDGGASARAERMSRALELRNMAAYNRLRAAELEAEANELIADEMREYVDSSEAVAING